MKTIQDTNREPRTTKTIVLVLVLSLVGFLLWQASTQAEEIISVGDQWRYFKGTSAPSENWNTLGFDDS